MLVVDMLNVKAEVVEKNTTMSLGTGISCHLFAPLFNR